MAKSDILLEPSEYSKRKDLHGVISENNFKFLDKINENTDKLLGKTWAENIKKNKKYWYKHPRIYSLAGIGVNKAVIGIGSGRSFNKNCSVLKDIIDEDSKKKYIDKAFITIAANHQYKPLLNIGIIPDFVILVDASDVVTKQLIEDIPAFGRKSILITGIHCSPEVIAKWTEQKRKIVFYTTQASAIQDSVREYFNDDPKKTQVQLGGNTINGAFMLGTSVMKSTVFMGVGNDLSFEICKDLDKQRTNYYSDKNYESNAKETGTGRDEGASLKKWAGFKFTDKNKIELELVGTSHTLWVYKNWLEITMMGQTQYNCYINYMNCTEGGILGVMAKENTAEAYKKAENWFMLDSKCINKFTQRRLYHTLKLEKAAEIFLKGKRLFNEKNKMPDM